MPGVRHYTGMWLLCKLLMPGCTINGDFPGIIAEIMSVQRRYFVRRETTEVMVGGTGIGGSNPVRVQSMTSTPTLDTRATVEQIIRIADAGADIVRMTVQSIREAKNLENIKRELRSAGSLVPLVADVHFNPAIAEIAAAVVDKVRINPGNFGIASARASVPVSAKAYEEELAGAKKAFFRLLEICRGHGTALRIGVNHGSLSPRIIYRYGNTPEGMVNSAMEFLRFCAEARFDNVLVSLKSSNILVMVQSNRLMVRQMEEEGMMYPLHLGVTEAGEGEDGRVRSAAGIGTLLSEGIGDTIRVSLTEDPEKEIPVAVKLLAHIERRRAGGGGPLYSHEEKQLGRTDLQQYIIRKSSATVNIGGGQVPVVVGTVDPEGDSHAGNAATLRETCEKYSDGGTGSEEAPLADYLFCRQLPAGFSPGGRLLSGSAERSAGGTDKADRSGRSEGENSTGGSEPEPEGPIIIEYSLWKSHYSGTPGFFPLVDGKDFPAVPDHSVPMIFLQAAPEDLTEELLEKAAADKRVVFVALSRSVCPRHEMGNFLDRLEDAGCRNPVIFRKEYLAEDIEDFQVRASIDFAPLFLEQMGDGLWLENADRRFCRTAVSTAFSILQSARARISKTEFISCPSCGRTMFDIQKATAEVKRWTSHLKGLKIAIMGCIVNGPGEMADADYGYVGSGKARVSLYKKQDMVRRDVPEHDAVEQLISLIKEGGDWVEP